MAERKYFTQRIWVPVEILVTKYGFVKTLAGTQKDTVESTPEKVGVQLAISLHKHFVLVKQEFVTLRDGGANRGAFVGILRLNQR